MSWLFLQYINVFINHGSCLSSSSFISGMYVCYISIAQKFTTWAILNNQITFIIIIKGKRITYVNHSFYNTQYLFVRPFITKNLFLPDKALNTSQSKGVKRKKQNEEPDENEDEDEQLTYSDEEGGMHVDGIYIPPPAKPACSVENNGPRIIITKIVNNFFKSYGKGTALGPFHKVKLLFKEKLKGLVWLFHT